jgi:hypothetical protein
MEQSSGYLNNHKKEKWIPDDKIKQEYNITKYGYNEKASI